MKLLSRYPEPLVCRACNQPFKGGEIAIPFYKVVESHGVVAAERITSGMHVRCMLVMMGHYDGSYQARENVREFIHQEMSS